MATDRTEYNRAWARANKDKRKASRDKWREKNAEHKREADRLYVAEHREEIKAKAKAKNWFSTPELREKKKEYREKHRKETAQYHRDYRASERKELISMLGGRCIRCGFSDWRALQIDHVNGGGNQERKQLNSPTRYYKAIRATLVAGEQKYQLLCANCNQIKRYEQRESGPSRTL